ncbi:MAG: hypothetical protein ACOX8X_05675 [Methanomethylophilus sp.]|jgi:hypothetical protein
MQLRDEDKIKRKKEKDEAKRRREAEKDAEARKKGEVREREQVRKQYRNNSAAHREMHNLGTTILKSSAIILVAVVFFEVLCYLVCDTWGTWETHLVNLADNSAAFIVGLTAMDAIMYINQAQSRRRSEERAIVRHNRIVQPAIDMYLARKNMMLTAPKDNVRTYLVKSGLTFKDLANMYEPSDIITDAGKTRIECFRVQHKALNKAFMNMVEDIDFDFNPEICDATLKFINASTYGSAALDSLIAYQDESMRARKSSLIRQIRSSDVSVTLGDAGVELKNAMLLAEMIQQEEEAIEEYIITISEMSAVKSTVTHYEL